MMKYQQKIWEGFCSQKRAENFALIHSVISTAKKQDKNMMEVLRQIIQA